MFQFSALETARSSKQPVKLLQNFLLNLSITENSSTYFKHQSGNSINSFKYEVKFRKTDRVKTCDFHNI